MPLKPVHWIGSSRDDLKTFPEDVQDVIGYALYLAQLGGKHPDAKPLTRDPAFRGAGVLEVVENYDGNTYRAPSTRCGSRQASTCCTRFRRNRRGVSRPRRATSTGSNFACRRRKSTMNARTRGPKSH